MAEEKREKHYWLHRITGGPNAMKVSHPLLFGHKILSTGWLKLSTDDFVANSLEDTKYFNKKFKQTYPTLNNRHCLENFLKMKKGDWVIVPTWGKFSIYEIADDKIYTTESLSKIIAIDKLKDWKGKHVYVDENKFLRDADNKIIDLGFFRNVIKQTDSLPRQAYADDTLFKRMKFQQTNVDITKLEKNILDSFKRWEEKRPIIVHDELLEEAVKSVKKVIDEDVQYIKFEHMVHQYLKALGATVENTSHKKANSGKGDADRVATFEDLKLIIQVQVKKQDGNTPKHGVDQIVDYSESHPEEGYSVIKWVISSAEDFTEEAKQEASQHNVRLINGEEFARMILEVGLKHFE